MSVLISAWAFKALDSLSMLGKTAAMTAEIHEHCLDEAVFLLSPHHDARPDEGAIELIVVHGISLPPAEFGGPGIDQLFLGTLDPAEHPYYAEISGMRVSSHLLIRRDGKITQYVPFNRRAWHAGASEWCGRDCCNDFAIGIELEGTDDTPYTDVQYEKLAWTCAALIRHYPALSMDTVVGHCDIAPGRKTDPGPAFNWTKLRNHLARLLEQ